MRTLSPRIPVEKWQQSLANWIPSVRQELPQAPTLSDKTQAAGTGVQKRYADMV